MTDTHESTPASVWRNPIHFLAFGFGSGAIRPAPGTWGSAAALPVAWLLHVIGGPWLLILGIVAAAVAGTWAARIETGVTASADPGHVVIDEVLGMWIALLPVSFGAARADVGILALWPGWIVAFLAFRAFDIAKPGPIGRADRRGDVTGLMLDDALAGVFAALVVIVLGGIAHAFM